MISAVSLYTEATAFQKKYNKLSTFVISYAAIIQQSTIHVGID